VEEIVANILRPKQVYGPGNPIPVGPTKFYEDFVLHDEADPFVPGTNVRRARSVPLGERARGFFDDEILALVEALRQLRDATPLKMLPPPKRADGKRRTKRKAA
jgi:hypothetical protein